MMNCLPNPIWYDLSILEIKSEKKWNSLCLIQKNKTFYTVKVGKSGKQITPCFKLTAIFTP